MACGGSGASPVRGPPRQPTTVEGCGATGPAGSVAVTVSSSLVQVIPIAEASRRRTAAVSEPGARSCGSRDTASPAVRTLPASASRSVSGLTERLTSIDPVTVIERAAGTCTGARTTSDPSVNPRLDSVRSSSSAVPGAACPAAASAALHRAPVSRTASHGRKPRASRTSGCSRTTPRRASTAEVVSLAVRVICGALTTSEPTATDPDCSLATEVASDAEDDCAPGAAQQQLLERWRCTCPGSPKHTQVRVLLALPATRSIGLVESCEESTLQGLIFYQSSWAAPS